MAELRKEIKEALFEVQDYLKNSDLNGAYAYLNERFDLAADVYVPQVTLALYDAGIDPLRYTDTVPDNFLFSIYIQLHSIPTTFKLPNNIKYIGEFAFAHSSLKEIELPDSIFSIGRSAFLDTSITTLRLPRSVEMIDTGAFNGCDDLKTIFYEGTEEEFLDLLENSSGGDIYENSLKAIFGSTTAKKIRSGEVKIEYRDGFSRT